MVSDSVLSVAEVNDRLPLVRSIVRDLVQLHGDVMSRRQRLQGLRKRHPAGGSSIYEDEVQQMEAELAADETRLDGYVDELRQLGGVVTDPGVGCVDFLSQYDGESVWLCWQYGETSVNYWHAGACSDAGRLALADTLATVEGGGSRLVD